MKKRIAGIFAAGLCLLIISAGCVSAPAASTASTGISDQVIGVWTMDLGDDYVRYYEYQFNSDLTGKEILYAKNNSKKLDETSFTWVRINDTYKATYNDNPDQYEELTISKDGKKLTDEKYNFTYHKK